MTRRHQPPVATPVGARSILTALAAVFSRGRVAESVRREVGATFAPRAILLTDSGTTALTLALLAALRDNRGPVALPAYGCFDLATAVVGAGGRAVFYDLEPLTLQPERGSLARALAARPSSLVVAHLFGMPVDLGAVAPRDALPAMIIDDAAQAVGASLHGQPVGSLGAFGVLSFGRGKGIGGAGGGALLAYTDEAARLMDHVAGRLSRGGLGLTSWGKLVALWVLGRPALYGVPAALPFLHLGETRYRPPHPPRAIGASGAGAVGGAWGGQEPDLRIRHGHAQRLDAAAQLAPAVQRIVPPAGAVPGYLRYPVLAATLAARVVAWRSLGVERGYPHPLPALPALRAASVNGDQGFPGAATLSDSLITLPTHRFLRERDHQALRAMLLGERDPVARPTRSVAPRVVVS